MVFIIIVATGTISYYLYQQAVYEQNTCNYNNMLPKGKINFKKITVLKPYDTNCKKKKIKEYCNEINKETLQI